MNGSGNLQAEDYWKPTPIVRCFANKMARFFRTKTGRWILCSITVVVMTAILVSAMAMLVVIVKHAFGI